MSENLVLRILRDYWAQLTILLTVIGYFIKIIIDRFIKLKEITFSNTHQEKIVASQKLYSSFISAMTSLKHLNARILFSFGNDDEIHKNVDIGMTKLNADLLALKLLIPENHIGFLNNTQKKVNNLYFEILTLYLEIKGKSEDNGVKKRINEIDNFFGNEYQLLLDSLEKYLRIELGIK